MIKPYSIAVDGYNSSTLAMSSNGYISILTNIALGTFGFLIRRRRR